MAKRPWRRMDRDTRKRVYRLAAKGWTQPAIAADVARSLGSVRAVLRDAGGVFRASEAEVSEARLSLEDRVEIRIGVEAGESTTEIGARIGRHRSTVWRELRANGRAHYRPVVAHELAGVRSRRPKDKKLATKPALCARVIEELELLSSPEQIAGRLRREFPDDATMWVSHETIYKSLYVQGRGELRRELARCLRSGRAQRKSRQRIERRGQIPNKVMISERPAEVEDRAVPGHWEGDLILGAGNRSAIGTAVERASRFTVLLHLPDNHSAEAVRDALTAKIRTLPAALRGSVTWDQGHEMAQHERFSIDTGVAVYFCDPRSPWQRPTNENTNGLLRQFFPKGTDLSAHDEAALDAAAANLNRRPRKVLGFMTPSEKLAELLVATTD